MSKKGDNSMMLWLATEDKKPMVKRIASIPFPLAPSMLDDQHFALTKNSILHVLVQQLRLK